MQIKPGQRVRDTVTGFEGIVAIRHEYFKGAVRLSVHGEYSTETQSYAELSVFEGQCELVDNGLLEGEIPLTDLEF